MPQISLEINIIAIIPLLINGVIGLYLTNFDLMKRVICNVLPPQRERAVLEERTNDFVIPGQGTVRVTFHCFNYDYDTVTYGITEHLLTCSQRVYKNEFLNVLYDNNIYHELIFQLQIGDNFEKIVFLLKTIFVHEKDCGTIDKRFEKFVLNLKVFLNLNYQRGLNYNSLWETIENHFPNLHTKMQVVNFKFFDNFSEHVITSLNPAFVTFLQQMNDRYNPRPEVVEAEIPAEPLEIKGKPAGKCCGGGGIQTFP